MELRTGGQDDTAERHPADRPQKPPDRLTALLLVLIALLVAVGAWFLIDGVRHQRPGAAQSAPAHERSGHRQR